MESPARSRNNVVTNEMGTSMDTTDLNTLALGLKLDKIIEYNLLLRNNTSKNIYSKSKKHESCSTTSLASFRSANKNRQTEDNHSRPDCGVYAECAKLLECKQLMKSTSSAAQHNTSLERKVNEKITFIKTKEREPFFSQNLTKVNDKRGLEKTTYCRPVSNNYSQEFVLRSIERNARLQLLVKKLVEAREREKHEAWNYYINELRNKHRCWDHKINNKSTVLADKSMNHRINDCYSTRYKSCEQNVSQHLLNDLYGATNEDSSQETVYRPRTHRNSPLINKPYKYENNNYCFPTASQGRLMMLNEERRKARWKYPPVERHIPGNIIIVDKEPFIRHKKNTRSVQTKHDFLNCKECLEKSNIEYTEENDVDIPNETMIQTRNKQSTLSNIENKIDKLIHTFTSFLEELKSKKSFSPNKSNVSTACDASNCMKTGKGTCEPSHKKNKEVMACTHENNLGAFGFSGAPNKQQNSIDDILNEEMNKSEKVKRDIDEILCNNGRDSSYKITIDVPTKEHATEITNSLSNTGQNMTVEEIGINVIEGIDGTPDSKSMTIAVNTDPMGLLALFRVSTETIKQVLSYMPNIDYFYYLSRLQGVPRVLSAEVSRYVCNICGKSFNHPTQLREHIRVHNLRNPRGCCVCRHVLDMKRHRRVGNFPCQHCGQMFTRAYCRELHEQECCKQFGRKHDVASSLILLS